MHRIFAQNDDSASGAGQACDKMSTFSRNHVQKYSMQIVWEPKLNPPRKLSNYLIYSELIPGV